MHRENNKTKIIIPVILVSFIILALGYYFLTKNKTYDANVKLEDKQIPKETKEILTNLTQYNKDNPVAIEEGEKVKNIEDIKPPVYTPKGGVDGKKEIEKVVSDDVRLKTAEELGIKEKQRQYIIKVIENPFLAYDDYYTSSLDQYFQTPEEYKESLELVINDYLATYPERQDGLIEKQEKAVRDFLKREIAKSDLGKSDPKIILMAEQDGIDINSL